MLAEASLVVSFRILGHCRKLLRDTQRFEMNTCTMIQCSLLCLQVGLHIKSVKARGNLIGLSLRVKICHLTSTQVTSDCYIFLPVTSGFYRFCVIIFSSYRFCYLLHLWYLPILIYTQENMFYF